MKRNGSNSGRAGVRVREAMDEFRGRHPGTPGPLASRPRRLGPGAAEFSHDLFLALPDPHAGAIEISRLGLSEDGGNGVVHGRRREDQAEQVIELKYSLGLAGASAAAISPSRWSLEIRQGASGFAGGGIVKISVPIDAERDPDADVRICQIGRLVARRRRDRRGVLERPLRTGRGRGDGDAR